MVINSWILMNHLTGARQETEGGGNWRKFRLFNFKNEIVRFLLQKPQLRQTRFATSLSTTTKTSSLLMQSVDNDIDEEKKRKREYKSAVEEAACGHLMTLRENNFIFLSLCS